MGKHLQRDLDHLKREILSVGGMVEQVVNRSIEAFVNRRLELAQEIIQGDVKIDETEVAIEEECLKILALHQPVARDLRFIITVLKVNNDLERMGDYAANIAERVIFLARHDPIPVPTDFGKMAGTVQKMVRDSLDSLIHLDEKLARETLQRDAEVDRVHREMFTILQNLMIEKPATIPCAIPTLSISRYLERIADLATNVAEDVIFLVEGELVRHRHEILDINA